MNTKNSGKDAGKKFEIFAYLKVVLIPILVYALMLLGFFGVLNLKLSVQSVAMSGIMLLAALLLARHNAAFAYSALPKNADDFKAKIKEFIVQNLLDIGGVKKSSADFETFFGSYTKNLRNENIASMASFLFAALGLLGTFFSIASFMPSFGAGNELGIQDEINTLLSGVGMAFYVCIYGIFLAIWWVFFDRLGLSKFENFKDEQRLISKQFFWQKDELEQRFISLASQHFSDIKTTFARISNEEFFARLDGVVGDKFKSYTDLQALEQRMIGEAQIKIDQNIRLLNKAGAKQDEFIKVHTEILKATLNLNSALKEIQTSFATEYNRLNELLQDRVNGFEKSVNKFELNLKTLEASLKEFANSTIDEQKKTMAAFRESVVGGVAAFAAVYEKELPNGAELQRQISIDELKKEASELDNQVQKVMQNLQDQAENESK